MWDVRRNHDHPQWIAVGEIMRAHGKALDEMTPEQRAAIEAIRARRHTPDSDSERDRFREEIRKEFPPAIPDESLLDALASLKAERERQGLSLADLSERTGMDKATLSKLETGKVANPTYGTIRTYARALGKRVVWRIEEEVAVSSHLAEGYLP
jgi:ribosome-binding protein aMBF1 (putative translation factor)